MKKFLLASIKVGWFGVLAKEFLFFENVLKSKKYILIGSNYTIARELKQLSLLVNYTYVSAKVSFLLLMSKIIKAIKTSKITQLTLEGAGWGMFLHKHDAVQQLELRLGYTQRIYLLIPTKINAYIRKKFLFLESFNSMCLGNFVAFICLQRMPQVFTGRGFWKKRQKRFLKEVKKKIKV